MHIMVGKYTVFILGKYPEIRVVDLRLARILSYILKPPVFGYFATQQVSHSKPLGHGTRGYLSV